MNCPHPERPKVHVFDPLRFSKKIIRGTWLAGILIFVLSLLLHATLHAAGVSISWDPNPESDIAGYNLYKRTLPSLDYGSPVFSGPSFSTTISNLQAGNTYGFIVTAYDHSGNESGPSQEKQIALPATGSPPPLAQGTMTKYWVDSEEPGNPGEAAFDGSTATFWHTQWQPSSPPHPHSLQVDLGAVYSIGGIQYQTRDAFFGANGRIGQYEVYVATNSATPPTIPPVLSQWTLVQSGVFQNNTSVQQVTFNPVTSRYVWLRALSEAQNTGKPWTAVGEFNVLGTASSGQVSINPTTATVPTGAQQQFTGSGGTPCSPSPYAFTISTNQSGGTIGSTTGLYTAGPNAGTDTIRIADCSVPEKSATAAVTVTGFSGGPLPSIPQGNLTKYWVDSEQSGNPGEVAFDGSTATFWHTQWQPSSPPPPHSLQVDLGAVYSIGGIRYQSRDAFYGANGRIGQYEVYVATNSATPPTTPPVLSQWTLVKSGVFHNNTTEQETLFKSVSSQYVWLRVLSEAQNTGKPWTAVGEFNVLGTLK